VRITDGQTIIRWTAEVEIEGGPFTTATFEVTPRPFTMDAVNEVCAEYSVYDGLELDIALTDLTKIMPTVFPDKLERARELVQHDSVMIYPNDVYDRVEYVIINPDSGQTITGDAAPDTIPQIMARDAAPNAITLVFVPDNLIGGVW
ncbi:hypothetical protein, partial [Pseudomonas aeruginosa]